MDKKIVYTLTGEGARGLFQAQAIKYLEDNHVTPSFLIGVSSGAINAVGYSLLGAEGLVKFWSGIKKMKDVFSFNWDFFLKTGFYNPTPILEKLKVYKDYPFKSQVSIPHLNVFSGKIYWSDLSESFDQKSIDATIEAISIPGLVSSEEGNVDAGAVLLCPLKKAIDLGADHIYVIMARNPDDEPEFSKTKYFPFLGFCYRSLDLMMYKLIFSDIETALAYNERPDKKRIEITLVYPEKPLFGTLDFYKVQDLVTNPVKILTKKLA